MIPTLDQLTAAWFSQLLDTSVQEARYATIGEGVGMMSALGRVTLSYDSAGSGPDTVIVKSPALNATNRQVAIDFRTYEREARFLKELAPRCQARTPEVMFCEVDEAQNFLIVMEDLADYRLGDQIAGANLADTQVCIDELARLHASFWNDVDHIEWIPGIANSHHADAMQAGLAAGWPNTQAAFGSVIPDAVVEMFERFQRALPRLQEAMLAEPRTLLHGDFRLENLFFGEAEQHPLVILDWQGPLLGRGVDEVAFFLAQNSQLSVRQQHERALVERYVDQLVGLGVAGYTVDDAWRDYRLGVLYNWCYVVVVSGTLDTTNEHARAWMTQMVSRNAQAIIDLDCFDLL